MTKDVDFLKKEYKKEYRIKNKDKLKKQMKEYNLKNKRLTAQYLTFEQDANGETELNANWIRYKLQKINYDQIFNSYSC